MLRIKTVLKNVKLFMALTLISWSSQSIAQQYVSQQPLPGIPANQQFTTISEAVAQAAPGDIIEIHTGVYRESVLIPKAKSSSAATPFRLVAAPNAEVVICGSDVLTGWQQEPGIHARVFSTAWTLDFSTPHPNDAYHQLIGRQEQVFIDGELLQQVLEKQQLVPGTFTVDKNAERLYIYPSANTDINQLHIEASTRPFLMNVEANYVQLKGIRFLHAANRAQSGMLNIAGRNIRIEHCILEQSNGTGITFKGSMSSDRSLERTNITLYNCEIKNNGHVGFSGNYMNGLLMENCVVSGNNAKNFSNEWESGGGKFMYCRDVVFSSSIFSQNRGPGIWIDFGNEDVEVKNCLLMENGTTGLYYEASYTLHAHDNVVIDNAYVGIGLTQSMGCLIERNLIIGNGEVGVKHSGDHRGVYRLDTPATSPDTNPSHWFPSGAAYYAWNAEHIVRNNIYAEKRGVSGWMDVTVPPYQWPSHLNEQMLELIAQDGESMQLRHENNFFAPASPITSLFSGTFKELSIRLMDLVKNYRPDILYFDNNDIPAPALDACKYLYEKSRDKNGHIQAVVTVKKPQEGTVRDFEKGIADGIQDEYWQTDTSLNGAWFIKPGDGEGSMVESSSSGELRHNARTLQELFVDIISKRGVLLLNLPVYPDGSIPGEQITIMNEFGGWINAHSEAVFATEPWKVYGKGGEAAGGHFNERTLASQPWNEDVYRFTCNKDKKTLYIHIFGNPAGKEILISELAAAELFSGKIKKVSMVSGKKSVQWKMTPGGLSILMPAVLDFPNCNVIKITTTGLW